MNLRRRHILILTLGVLTLATILIVSLPCSTFRVNLTNELVQSAEIRIFMRGEELWHGRLAGGHKLQIPILEWNRSDVFVVHFRYADIPDGEWSHRYGMFSLNPFEVSDFEFSLNKKAQRQSAIQRHPWAMAFDSSTWRTMVYVGLTAYWGLRCLDCLVLRIFESDAPTPRQN